MIKNLSKRLRENNKKKGFTLIELLIVMAIMVILAAVAVPKLGTYKESANEKAEVSAAKNIHTAINSLIADDKIKVTGETITINLEQTTGTAQAVRDLVETSDLQGKTKGNTNTFFTAVIDADGNIEVQLGTGENAKDVYPQK